MPPASNRNGWRPRHISVSQSKCYLPKQPTSLPIAISQRVGIDVVLRGLPQPSGVSPGPRIIFPKQLAVHIHGHQAHVVERDGEQPDSTVNTAWKQRLGRNNVRRQVCGAVSGL